MQESVQQSLQNQLQVVTRSLNISKPEMMHASDTLM